MELHRKLGIATPILGGLIVVWRLWRRDQLGRRARLLTLVAMLAMAGTLGYGAYLGDRLVYEFGVGGPSANPRRQPTHPVTTSTTIDHRA